jgi:CBS domain-containing protein
MAATRRKEDRTMRVAEVMNPVETIEPDATLRRAAQRMRDLDVGSIPVCNGDRLVGIITDRDVTVRATAEGKDPATCKVEQAMTPHVDYVIADDDVQHAAQLMQEKQVRRLPVLDGQHRLVGTVSLGDLSHVLKPNDSSSTLREISRPAGK